MDRLVLCVPDALQVSNPRTQLSDHRLLEVRSLTTMRQCSPLGILQRLQAHTCTTPGLRRLQAARPWCLCARTPTALGVSTMHTSNSCLEGPLRLPAPVGVPSATIRSMAWPRQQRCRGSCPPDPCHPHPHCRTRTSWDGRTCAIGLSGTHIVARGSPHLMSFCST